MTFAVKLKATCLSTVVIFTDTVKASQCQFVTAPPHLLRHRNISGTSLATSFGPCTGQSGLTAEPGR